MGRDLLHLAWIEEAGIGISFAFESRKCTGQD